MRSNIRLFSRITEIQGEALAGNIIEGSLDQFQMMLEQPVLEKTVRDLEHERALRDLKPLSWLKPCLKSLRVYFRFYEVFCFFPDLDNALNIFHKKAAKSYSQFIHRP